MITMANDPTLFWLIVISGVLAIGFVALVVIDVQLGNQWEPVSFSQMNWWDRFVMFYAFVCSGVFSLWVFGFVFLILSSAADGISRHNVEHDKCLKQATNGYEIKQCGR